MSAANPPQPLPVPATAPTADERLQAIEKRLKEPKPEGKDGWDKFEKLSTLMWSVVTLLVSIFVTGRIEELELGGAQVRLANAQPVVPWPKAH
jgi:hypothetical protein